MNNYKYPHAYSPIVTQHKYLLKYIVFNKFHTLIERRAFKLVTFIRFFKISDYLS